MASSKKPIHDPHYQAQHNAQDDAGGNGEEECRVCDAVGRMGQARRVGRVGQVGQEGQVGQVGRVGRDQGAVDAGALPSAIRFASS